MAITVDVGRDTSCGPKGLRTGRLSRGVVLLAESAFRRLTTPRGTLRGGDEENIYGEDLTALVGRHDSASLEAALPGIVRAELLKDERFYQIDVTCTRTQDGPAVSYVIEIACVTAAGPFTLKLAVSDVSASLLGIA